MIKKDVNSDWERKTEDTGDLLTALNILPTLRKDSIVCIVREATDIINEPPIHLTHRSVSSGYSRAARTGI